MVVLLNSQDAHICQCCHYLCRSTLIESVLYPARQGSNGLLFCVPHVGARGLVPHIPQILHFQGNMWMWHMLCIFYREEWGNNICDIKLRHLVHDRYKPFTTRTTCTKYVILSAGFLTVTTFYWLVPCIYHVLSNYHVLPNMHFIAYSLLISP